MTRTSNSRNKLTRNKYRVPKKNKLLILIIISTATALGIWRALLVTDFDNTQSANKDQIHSQEIQVTASVRNNSFGRYDRIRASILTGKFSEIDLDDATKIYTHQEDVEQLRAILQSSQGDISSRESLYKIHVKAEPNPDVIYDYIKLQMDLKIGNARDRPDERATPYAWAWGYLATASCFAFRATGDERFLDLIVESYEEILANRDDLSIESAQIHGVPVQPSWGIMREKNGEMQYMYIVTHAGRIGFPVLLFCEIVQTNPSLHDKYLHISEMFLESVIETMNAFDSSFVTDEESEGGYYVSPLRDMIEPINHSHAAGATLVMLYELTGDEAHLEKVVKLANYFRSCIVEEDNGSYVWGYRPQPEDRMRCEGEWSWKGAITIIFPIVVYEKGLAFTSADMQAFANTFLKNISPSEDIFNQTIYSTDHKPTSKTRYDTATGWNLLNTINPSVQGALEDVMIKRTDLFPGGWFQNAATAQAYCYKLYTHRSKGPGTVTLSNSRNKSK